MKTQSQHIADMIVRGEPEFSTAKEIIKSVMMLVVFVAFMALIMYVGSAAGY